jgi:hypothetical protein
VAPKSLWDSDSYGCALKVAICITHEDEELSGAEAL